MAENLSISQRLRVGRATTIKTAVQQQIDIYRDNWEYIIREELLQQVTQETYAKYKLLVTQELNVTKRVVNELSLVYKESAERKAVLPEEAENEDGETEEKLDDNYEMSQKDTNKNFAMQGIEKFTNLNNNTLLKITYRDEKLDYDVLNFNNAEIFTDDKDWKKILAVKHYFGLILPNVSRTNEPFMKVDWGNEGVADDAGLVQDYSEAKVWVKEDIPRRGIIEDGTNDILQGGFIYTVKPVGEIEIIESQEPIPYTDTETGEFILPFVLFTRHYPIEQLLDFSTGNDLRDLNINIAILMVWLNTVEKYQSFKQLVFNTDDPESIPNNLKLGPGEALINPTKEGGGSVQVLDLQASIQDKQMIIERRILQVLSGYNISPQNFTMSADAQSGLAMEISNMGKLEARQSQLPLYTAREKEVFEVEKKVWNYHRPGEAINEDAELVVDFAEITFPKSPDEQVKEFEFLKKNNAVTDIDLIMDRNPELTREQAEVIYTKNKAFNDANRPAPIQLQPMRQPGGTNALREKEKEEETQINGKQ